MNQRPMTSFGSLTDLSRQSNMWVMSISLPSFPTLAVLTFLTSAFNLQNQMRLRCFDVFQQGFPQRKWDLCRMKWTEKKIHTHFQHDRFFFSHFRFRKVFSGSPRSLQLCGGRKGNFGAVQGFCACCFQSSFSLWGPSLSIGKYDYLQCRDVLTELLQGSFDSRHGLCVWFIEHWGSICTKILNAVELQTIFFSFPRHQVIFNNSLREEDQGALLVRLPIDQVVFFKGWNGNIEDLQTLS